MIGRRWRAALAAVAVAGGALTVLHAAPASAARITAADNDPENKLWDCATRRAPFGDLGQDVPRCFTFRYNLSAGGVTSAFLHLKIKPQGQQDTDTVNMAVASQPTTDCDWGKGGMSACVMVHVNIRGDGQSLNLNLLDIACNPNITSDAGKQAAVRAQLNTGVVHFMLQDDTALLAAELVLNEGPATVACGVSTNPANPVTGGTAAVPTTVPTTVVSAGAASVRAEKPAYTSSERITLVWSGFPGGSLTDWISIVAAGSADDKYTQWVYLEGKTQGQQVFNPMPPGTYEARGYFNWTAGGYNVRARSTFTVTGAASTAPATAPATAPRATTVVTALPPTVPPTPPPTTASAVIIPNDADAACLVGDVDNLGFGFAAGFDVFSGRSTPPHAYPWAPPTRDAPGTDRIMVGTKATRLVDGYAQNTQRSQNRPQAIVLRCVAPKGLRVTRVAAQLFIDDFQAPAFGSRFTATLNGKHWAQLEAVLNAVNQTGPIGKLVTVDLPTALQPLVLRSSAKLLIDDATSGVGDGYAIDFVRILLNPRPGGPRGELRGRVVDNRTKAPVAAAVIRVGTVESGTDATGAYGVGGLPAGLAIATASAPGYLPTTGTVDVITGQTSTLDLALEPAPTTTTTTTPPTTTAPPTTTTTNPPPTTPPPTTPPPTTPSTIPPTTPPASTSPRTTAPLSTTGAPTAPPTTRPAPTAPPTTRPAPTAPRPTTAVTAVTAVTATLAVANPSTRPPITRPTTTRPTLSTTRASTTSTTRPSATTRPGGDGDCDGNGRIDEADALCALQMSVRLVPPRAAGDVDGESGVTSRDAAVLLRRATGRT